MKTSAIRYSPILVATALAIGLTTLATAPVDGSETATATIGQPTTQNVGGQIQYTYNLSLTNTSADTSQIGTFWFAWIPRQSYLHNNPLSVSQPTGWEDGPDSQSVGGALGEKGASIEWQATSSASYLSPGQTLSGFSFTTVDPPASVFGNSFFFPSAPVLTSEVYHAGPFSDSQNSFNGYEFVAQVVPEPSSWNLLSVIGLSLMPMIWFHRPTRKLLPRRRAQ